MPKVTAYLDCGCAIMENGSRVTCPTCAAALEPWQEITIQLPGDGSEHLDYIVRNMEHIPDFMQHSIAMVMDMAERWIKEQNGAP